MRNVCTWTLGAALAAAAVAVPASTTAQVLDAESRKELKALQPIKPTALDPTVTIGDKAPALPAMTWLKGRPVEQFEPGHVYVVDFWSTWCGPCIRGMPQLSALQKKYEGRVTVIGVNARQALRTEGAVDPAAIKATVEATLEKQGDRMAFAVAMEDPVTQPAYDVWLLGSGCINLGTAFIVDGAGRIVWIGYAGGPFEEKFAAAVDAAVNGRSDLQAARAVQEEQFGSSNVSIRYSVKLSRLLKCDEAAALKFVRAGAQDANLRAALGMGSDDAAYWGAAGIEIAATDGLSPQTYRVAAGYLEQFAAEKPGHFAPWRTLGVVYYKLGDKQRAIAAQEKALDLYLESGASEQEAEFLRTALRQYRTATSPSGAILPLLAPTLNIGDKAPALPVMAWIKGEPVTRFEPGQVYIVDFWATWCGVCIAGMPHLSALQRKYDGKLTVIGVNSRELAHATGPVDPAAVKAKVKASARKHSDKMIYAVAMDHPVEQPVFETWQAPSGGMRVPNAIVVDGNGVIVWNAPPSDKWKDKFDIAVEAAVSGKSDLELGRAVFQEQYGAGLLSLRFFHRFTALLRTDETAAMDFARAGFQEPEVRTAASYGGDETQYWGMIGLTMSGEEKLSTHLCCLAAAYIEQLIAAGPEVPARNLALAGLYYRLGENRKGAVAEERAMGMFRASGMTEPQLAQVASSLDRYRKR